MVTIFWLAISYLLGAMPFGLLISRTCCGIDPREQGSGNIGATNVGRLCGTKYGAMTLILDVLKGFAPVLLAASFSDSYFFLTLVATAAVCGHMFSVFLHGKGGKGVATWVGAFLAISPWAVVLCGLAFLAALPAPLPFANVLPAAALILYGVALLEEWPQLTWIGLFLTLGTALYFLLSAEVAWRALRALMHLGGA